MKSVFVTLNLFEKNQRCKILEDLQVYVVRQANVLTLSLSIFYSYYKSQSPVEHENQIINDKSAQNFIEKTKNKKQLIIRRTRRDKCH